VRIIATLFRLDKNGNINIAGNKITQEKGYNETTTLNDTCVLNENYIFNSNTTTLSSFIDYLFNITALDLTTNRMGFDLKGNIIASAFYENVLLDGRSYRFNNDKSISLTGVITEGVVF